MALLEEKDELLDFRDEMHNVLVPSTSVSWSTSRGAGWFHHSSTSLVHKVSLADHLLRLLDCLVQQPNVFLSGFCLITSTVSLITVSSSIIPTSSFVNFFFGGEEFESGWHRGGFLTVGLSVGQVDDLYQSILILECLVDCTHNPQTHRFQFFFDPKRFVEKVKDETLADELRWTLVGKT